MKQNDKVVIYKNNILYRICYDIGILITLFIISNILLTTIFQFINISMSPLNVIISSIAAILIYLYLRKDTINNNLVTLIVNIVFSVIIVLVSTYISGHAFDMTCDGNAYHKTAIGILEQGWNPVKESSYDFNLKNNAEMADDKMSLWIDHYPKATWNFASSIYSITGNIESGKVISLLMIVITFLLSFSYFSMRHLKPWQGFLIAVLLALNPIICSQIFSYYVDGIMGLAIYNIVLFLIILSDNKFNYVTNLEKWSSLGSFIILCMNIKFTGVLFAGIFCILFYLYWLWIERKNKAFKNIFINKTVSFVLIVLIGVVFVGYSSYVKNLIDHKNPLYPLMGDGKVDIVTTMQPVSFGEKNRVAKLYESIFSKSENVTYYSNENPEEKIPFTYTEDEINNSSIPDLRIGGFGILFSGILIISIISLILSLYKNVKEKSKLVIYSFIILIGIIITTLLIEESWWARYAPQLYLIPILAIINLFFVGISSKKILKGTSYFISILLMLLMMINILPFIKWRYYELTASRTIRKELYLLSEKQLDNKINIYLPNKEYFGILFNLKDYNFDYNIVEDKNMKNGVYNNWIMY